MTRVTTSAPDPTRPAGSPDEQARAAAEDLGAFVAASPSSFHAAAQVRDRLVARGFSELDEAAPWPSSPGGYVVVRDGGVIAWVVPTVAGPTTPFTVLGAHTDSPTFRRLADELVTLLAYEATRDVAMEEVEIQTPVATTTGLRLALVAETSECVEAAQRIADFIQKHLK